jgi:hypothetical protein
MSTLFLTKVPKAYNGEKTASSTNVAGTSGYLTCRKLKLDPCYHPALVSTQNEPKTLISDPKL